MRNRGLGGWRAAWTGLVLVLTAAARTRSEAPVTALAYRPDASALLVGWPGEVCEVARPDGPGPMRRHPVPLPRVAAVHPVPSDRGFIAAGGRPGVDGAVVRVRATPDAAPEVMARCGDLVVALDVSPDGAWVAWGDGADVRMMPVDPAGAGRRRILTGHSGPVRAVRFSPDGRHLVSVSVDRSVKVWSVGEGRELRSFGQHTGAVHALAFAPMAPGAVVCASAGEDRTIRVWQPAIGRMVRIIRGHAGGVNALAYSPAGDVLFSVGDEGMLRRIDAGSDRILAAVPVGDDVLYSLAVSPDGTELAVGDWTGSVRLVDGRTGATSRRLDR